MSRYKAPHRGVSVFDAWPNSVVENFYEAPSPDERLAAWCYADRLSYVAGDKISIHTCTTGRTYDLAIYRDGLAREDVFKQQGLPGRSYKTPRDCSTKGCGWPVALEVPVVGWKSGGYIIHITAHGEDGLTIDHHYPIAVRAQAPSVPNAILLVTCTATWLAYNDWGGSNYYEGIEGAEANHRAVSVNTQRPFSRGFAWLPKGAPRIPLKTPPELGAAIRHPHMEWAYANGFSKKYASAGWATYDRHFLIWAEAQGFVVDVATQHDIHRDPSILQKYACVSIVGHDEYWSWEMRDAFDSYVEGGGRVARFAGNFKWQVRVENDGTQQICYKTDAHHSDPVRDTDRRSRIACAWDDVAVGRPGTLTFGLSGSLGVYSGWAGCAPRASGGFTVYRPEHWAFEGTDLYYGDQLGAASKVFGYEVDGCDYTFRNGLPYPTGADGAPIDMEILAMGVSSTFEPDHGNPGSTFFIGTEDTKKLANTMFRRTDDETVERVKRGSGMIACFNKGRGTLFNAGSCEWVSGLIDRDPFVERMTKNVLSRFSVPISR